MALERASASQVVTFAPPRPAWSLSALTGGIAPSGVSWAAGFAGFPYLVAGVLGAGSTYDQVVASDSPSGWWKLADNPGSATAYDSSGNAHTGNASAVKFGIPNSAISGNTVAQYTTGAYSAVITGYNPALSAVTVECWVNLNGATQPGYTSPRFLANSHTDYNDYQGFELWTDVLYANSAAKATFGNGSARATVQSPTPLPKTGWTYLAATWDGTTVTLYVNGASVATAALSGSMPAGTSGGGIGVGYNPAYNGDYLTGLLAECAIYPAALPAARILAHYQAGTNVMTPQQPAQIGDRFQLFTGNALKQPDVFTIAGFTPSAGWNSWNIFFTPAPIASPAAGDTAVNIPRPGKAQWLGALGHVTNLKYSFTCPGGPDTMSCLLRLPPDYRTDAINPGRIVQVFRGANCVWEGKLDEPQPAQAGWTISAHGAGQYGADFTALWTVWNADNVINGAIARGLRWSNPGIGSPSGIYLAQQVDSGAQTVSAFLTLLCTGGSLTWMLIPPGVSGVPALPWVLQIFGLPQNVIGQPQYPPGRILISHSPVARTVAADINTLIMRYQVSSDVQATATAAAIPAVYGTITVQQAASVAAHGVMEYYLDVSSAGVLTVSQVQQIGNYILSKYVRASFAGSFTVGPGQLLNAGGEPVDLGCEKAGTIVQLMVTDAAYGGEVAMAPLTFMTGQYEFDDDTYTGTVTPLQSARNDMATLISAMYPGKFG
jgi:hypothetical protein